ncbi:hypothetical protein F4054_21845 [Candidatus Poribacteria bacterium]|nr:hypothetical protein [Candidatus Poribacteria bacterium]MYK24892.1 hypothetical protein [Candidatus Poribacteria bacterium]
MRRYLSIFIMFLAIVLLPGCQSKALQMLIEPQELYNYAVTEGVTCTAPEMIDGDVKTRGYADGRWIHLNLPTQKAIHRITINGTNIINAMIYEKLEGEGRWRAILQIQNNESPVIKTRFSGVVTDAIRIYISGTTDDEKKASQYDPRRGAIVPQIKLGRAFIHELEVYGFVSKEKSNE